MKSIKIGLLKKGKLYYKFLISFFLVLFIPLGLAGILGFNFFFQQFYDNTIHSNQILLEQGQETLDSMYVELKQMSNSILTHSFQGQTMVHDNSNPLLTLENMRFLQSIKSGNSMIDVILVYYNDTQFLCSNTAMNSLTSFFFYNELEGWDYEQFMYDISTNNKLFTKPSLLWTSVLNSIEVTPFVVPDIYNTFSYSTIYLINSNSIRNIFAGLDGNCILVSSDNEIILTTREKNYSDINNSDFLLLLRDGKDTTGYTLEVDGTKYIINYSISSISNIDVYHVIPEKQALSEVKTIRSISIAVYIFIWFIGSLLMIIFSRSNYRPIYLLKEQIMTKTGFKNKSPDEIATIRESMELVYNKTQELDTIVNNNKPAVTAFLLQDILNGNIVSRSRINEIGRNMGIKFSHDLFQVASVQINAIDNSIALSFNDIMRIIKKELPDIIEFNAKNNLHQNIIHIILCMEHKVSLESHLERITQIFSQQYNINMTIGVGSPYMLIENVGKSFIEASGALDHRLIYGNSVIYFESTPGVAYLDYTSFDNNTRALEIAIMSGDVTHITNIISDICQIIMRPGRPLYESRCLCYRAINAIIKTMEGINRWFKQDIDLPDVRDLVTFETVQNLEITLRTLSIDLCRFICTNKRNETEDTLIRITQYMETHYKDPDFSLQKISEALYLSQSFISHFYKARTGISIINAASQLRIDYSKTLLTQTDMTLDEITNEIGYWNTSSFIRKFKLTVGTTPGQYRRKQKCKKLI